MQPQRENPTRFSGGSVKHLNKHRGKRFTAAQLCNRTGNSIGAVNFAIGKLIRYKFIRSEVVSTKMQYNCGGRKLPCKRLLRKVWV